MPTRNILFYPSLPWKFSTISKILKTLNIKITNNHQHDYLLGIHWHDRTYTDFNWPEKTEKLILNKNCNNISKKHVDLIHEKILGYNSEINPRVYDREYVQKLDLNGFHLGFIRKRKSRAWPLFFYQKIPDNSVGNTVIEYRVPVFGDTVPFVYKKTKSIKKRLSCKNLKVELASFEETFNSQERNWIIAFAKAMRLNYGELDILQDHPTNKIYIIDANKTPLTQPNNLSKTLKSKAISIMADTFKNVFLS